MRHANDRVRRAATMAAGAVLLVAGALPMMARAGESVSGAADHHDAVASASPSPDQTAAAATTPEPTQSPSQTATAAATPKPTTSPTQTAAPATTPEPTTSPDQTAAPATTPKPTTSPTQTAEAAPTASLKPSAPPAKPAQASATSASQRPTTQGAASAAPTPSPRPTNETTTPSVASPTPTHALAAAPAGLAAAQAVAAPGCQVNNGRTVGGVAYINQQLDPALSVTITPSINPWPGTLQYYLYLGSNVLKTQTGTNFGGYASGTSKAVAVPYTFGAISANHIPDGEYTVRCTATISPDAAYTTVPVVFDSTAPVVSVTGPTDGAWVGGTASISAAVTDRNPDTTSLSFGGEVTCANGAAGTSCGSDAATLRVDTTQFEDGAYIVTAGASDKAGNQAAPASITLYVDNTAPVVTIDSAPTAILAPGDSIAVMGSVTERGSGLAGDSLEVGLAPYDDATDTCGAVTTGSSATISDGAFSLDLAGTKTGHYCVIAGAGLKDRVGNAAQGAVARIVVNAPPVIEPKLDDQSVCGVSLDIGADVTDANLTEATISVTPLDGAAGPVPTDAVWHSDEPQDTTVTPSLTWDTTGVAAGAYLVTFEALDADDVAAVPVTRTITIDPTLCPPVDQGGTDGPGNTGGGSGDTGGSGNTGSGSGDTGGSGNTGSGSGDTGGSGNTGGGSTGQPNASGGTVIPGAGGVSGEAGQGAAGGEPSGAGSGTPPARSAGSAGEAVPTAAGASALDGSSGPTPAAARSSRPAAISDGTARTASSTTTEADTPNTVDGLLPLTASTALNPPVRVAASSPAIGGTGELAATGTSPGALAALSAACCALGVLLALVRRRPRDGGPFAWSAGWRVRKDGAHD